MTNWSVPFEVAIPSDLLRLVGDPVLARLLVQRGITKAGQAHAFLSPSAYSPAPPSDLPDMEQAVDRLDQAIRAQTPICVWGDFDVDGQTSTTLLVEALRELGAKVGHYIPDRQRESHGIRPESLQRVIEQGAGLILTCDTGITDHAAIAQATEQGIPVIVTDHHDLAVSGRLPSAEAILNPKRLPESHPLRQLPGVGVAYKLAEGLFDALRPHQAGQVLPRLLDLVALGIVADVAEQRNDTRYLLQKGLVELNQTGRLGLQAIIENSKLTSKLGQLSEEHIGFWLGPRLNALGRLSNANPAVELLTSADRQRVNMLATQLEGLNAQRKGLVTQVYQQALRQIEEAPSLVDYHGLVLAGANWHRGVVGIAASRLVEKFGKPVVLLSVGQHGTAAGSARSVAGCDIHQAIQTQAGRLLTFGGHPMAAGLSLPADEIANFRRGLSDALADCAERAESSLAIDLELPFGDLSPALYRSIRRLAPFGAGNPEVKLACRNLTVVDETVFGRQQEHKRLTVADEQGAQQTVIWWGGVQQTTPNSPFDLAFTLGLNDYRGDDTLQLTWVAAQSLTPPDITVAPTLIDCRNGQHSALSTQHSTLTWPTTDLTRAEHLVLNVAPPCPAAYEAILRQVRPQTVYLIATSSEFDQPQPFLQQLMGLVKYALQHKNGWVDLPTVAHLLTHEASTVRLGLDWLVAQGKLALQAEQEKAVQVAVADQPPQRDVAQTHLNQLTHALREAASYRKFFGGSLELRF